MTKKEQIRQHKFMFHFFAEHAMNHWRLIQELEYPKTPAKYVRGKLIVDLKKLNKRVKK